MVMFGFVEISRVVKIAKTAGVLDRKYSMDKMEWQKAIFLLVV
jgi:hypothetical protein